MFWGTFFFFLHANKKKVLPFAINKGEATTLLSRLYKMPGDVEHGWENSAWKKCAAKQIRLNAAVSWHVKWPLKCHHYGAHTSMQRAIWPSQPVHTTMTSLDKMHFAGEDWYPSTCSEKRWELAQTAIRLTYRSIQTRDDGLKKTAPQIVHCLRLSLFKLCIVQAFFE